MTFYGATWKKAEIEELLQQVKDAVPLAEIAAAHKRTENAITCKIAAEIEKLHVAGMPAARIVADYGFDAAAVDVAIAKAGTQKLVTLRRDHVEAAGGNWAAILAAKPRDINVAVAAAYPAGGAKPAAAVAAPVQPAAAVPVQPAAEPVQSAAVPIQSATAPVQPTAVPAQIVQPAAAPAQPAQFEVAARAPEAAAPRAAMVSSALGVAGEAEVARILGASFSVANTSGTARSGDLHISREGRTILVEVKNYTNPVPGAEVEKFGRDLEARSELLGGLFVSLRSGISCQPDPVRFTEIAARPAILLHSVDPATIGAFALVLDRIIAERAAAARAARSLSARSSEAISAHLRDIAAAAGELSLSRTLLCELQDGLNRNIGKVQAAILAAEHRISTHIDALLDTIHDATETKPTVPENLAAATRDAIRAITPDAHCLGNSQCVAALSAILRRLPADTKLSTSASLVILSWGAARLELAPLKTRTNLSLVPGGDFTIPRWCKYDRGTIQIQMDTVFVTNHLDEFVALAVAK